MSEKLVSYKKDKERLEFLINEIKHYENFFHINKLTNIYLEYLTDLKNCRKSGVYIDRFNKLELYHANLKYHYEQI